MQCYVTYYENMREKNIPEGEIINPEAFLESDGSKGYYSNELYLNKQRTTRLQEIKITENNKLTIPIYIRKLLFKIPPSGLMRTVNRLDNFLESGNMDYHRFEIPKRTGGTRVIEAPNTDLKELQTHVAKFLKYDMKFLESDIAHGFVQGRSIATNAHQHRRSEHFAKIDFEDFFPTFTEEVMDKQLTKISLFAYADVFMSGIHDGLDEASVEYKLPHYKKYKNDNKEELEQKLFYIHSLKQKLIKIASKDGRLPQGSPLSPILTNLLMIPFDYHIVTDFATKNSSLIVTRYVDDLEISSLHQLGSDKEHAKERLHSVIERISNKHYDGALKIKKRKSRISTKYGKNRIAGIKVNQENKVSIGYKEKRWLKREIAKAIIQKRDTGEPPANANEVLGYLSFLNSIEPGYADFLKKKYEMKFNLPSSIERFLTE